ncbi:hypothetical protein F4775DRAFT_228999 [Biscogniauxia sp. FL1348]|nr:hypothetical protein F4775DRAFT_228999 [Biscogniauxia sp. FL1348]
MGSRGSVNNLKRWLSRKQVVLVILWGLLTTPIVYPTIVDRTIEKNQKLKQGQACRNILRLFIAEFVQDVCLCYMITVESNISISSPIAE